MDHLGSNVERRPETAHWEVGKKPPGMSIGKWIATEALWMCYRVFDCTVVSLVFPISYSYLYVTEASNLFYSFQLEKNLNKLPEWFIKLKYRI